MIGGWNSWTLAEWNRALVAAVFFDPTNLQIPITRIQASGQFLSQCTGELEQDPVAVQRAFTAAFGDRAASIRQRYGQVDGSSSETWRLGYPSNFADLYLTLLAASADDSTHGEGNFRNRFVELLHPLCITAPDFASLPSLWKQVAAWSEKRALDKGDCRVLRLPSTGHERLIGFSKRLAFPCYSDEIKLARCLQTAQVGSHTGFNSVASAVGKASSTFSAMFQEEFSAFLWQLSAHRFPIAYESPFWSAVLAITWETERHAAVRGGTFRLWIQASDPNFPELYLLADPIGRARLADYAARPAFGNDADYVILPPAEKGWDLDSLLAVGQTRMGSVRLWRLLKLGCLFLLPDGNDNLSSEGQHYNGGPACILIAGESARILVDAASSLSIRHAYAKLDGRVSWSAIIMHSVSSEALTSLANRLPSDMLSAFSSEWRPSKVRLAGAAWFGQFLLLNPASIPQVRWESAEGGQFELLDGSGKVIHCGPLVPVGDGFAISPAQLVACGVGRKIRFCLRGPNGEASVETPIGDSFPLLRTALPLDPVAWLSDGPSGKLASAYGRLSSDGTPSGGCLPLFARQDGTSKTNENCDGLQQLLSWVAEALPLRYQTRATLSFDEMMSHLSSGCDAVGVPIWRTKRLLFSASWLSVIQRRTSPYPSVSMSVRSVSIVESKDAGLFQVRFAGMFSAYELSRIERCLGPRSNLRRIAADGYPFGLGALEAHVLAEETVDQLVEDLGLEKLHEAGFYFPIFVDGRDNAPWTSVAAELPRDDLETWSGSSGKWMPLSGTQYKSPPGTLYRLRGRQRSSFWVAVPHGYWKTDSVAWAHMLRLVAAGQPVGQVAQNGSCSFHSSLAALPTTLITWWLHWGGGYIGVLPSGEIYFGGDVSPFIWDRLKNWFTYRKEEYKQDGYSKAEARRRLALRLARVRHTSTTRLGEQ